MTTEFSLIRRQDELAARLVKCDHMGRRGNFAAKVAENRFVEQLVVAGFTDQQAYAALCDARDFADLQTECERV